MRDFPAVALRWRHGLFAHWPVDASRVRPLVPDALDVHAREGTAWVSALASVVEDARPWPAPELAGVTVPQVNLRTYVRHETRPGVYFLSIDTAWGLGVRVARAVYGVPYYRADVDFDRTTTNGERTAYRFDSRRRATGGRRHARGGRDSAEEDRRRAEKGRHSAGDDPVRFVAEYRPTGPPDRADSDSLDDFLAERYRAYVVRGETVWCADIEHAPWPLCPAEASVHADSLLAAAGLPAPTDDPVVRYTPGVEMTVRTPFRP